MLEVGRRPETFQSLIQRSQVFGRNLLDLALWHCGSCQADPLLFSHVLAVDKLIAPNTHRPPSPATLRLGVLKPPLCHALHLLGRNRSADVRLVANYSNVVHWRFQQFGRTGPSFSGTSVEPAETQIRKASATRA